MRVLRQGGATLALLGHCLVPDAVVERGLRDAAAGGDPGHLACWPGGYSFVVSRDGEATAVGDPAGQFPLYWGRTADALVVGSHARLIAALVDARPDPVALAHEIFVPDLPLADRPRSAFHRVDRIVGGTLHLRLDRPPRWVAEPPQPDSTRRLDDCAADLRDVLVRAVAARADWGPPVSADLSGGLDSTSLAFLAADHLRRDTRHRLPAVVYCHPRLSPLDAEYAVDYAHLDPRLDLRVVEGTDTTLPYSGLDTLPPTDEPDPTVVITRRTALRLVPMTVAGARLHLTGEGGDAVLSAPPIYLADLLTGGHWRRFAGDCRAVARLRQESPLRLAWAAARAAIDSRVGTARRLIAALEAPARQRVWWDAVDGWLMPDEALAWCPTAMRRELAQWLDGCRGMVTRRAGWGLADQAALRDARASGQVHRAQRERARNLGVDLHAPFLDNEVVRTCLRLPAVRRADRAAFKPLLARALDGLVPEPVLRRTTKGVYTAEDYQGLRRNAGAVRRLLDGSVLAELGVVEPGAVREALDRAVLGLPFPFGVLNRLLGAELWLRGLDSPDVGTSRDRARSG